MKKILITALLLSLWTTIEAQTIPPLPNFISITDEDAINVVKQLYQNENYDYYIDMASRYKKINNNEIINSKSFIKQ